jgi:hypothetical protein
LKCVCREELGPLYLEQLDQKQVTRHLVRRLERLGHKVILEKADAAKADLAEADPAELVVVAGARSP